MRIPKPNRWNYPLFLTIYEFIIALLVVLFVPIRIFTPLIWIPIGGLAAIPFDAAWRWLSQRQEEPGIETGPAQFNSD